MMPFFSVVIPLYNKAPFIKRTLKSVLAQNFTDFEVIIINDGSSDDSLEIVEGFSDERIKIFSQVNEGVSIARNFGVKKANSKHIVFLDADDLWRKNHLQILKKLIEDFPNCGLYGTGYLKVVSGKQTIRAQFGSISNGFRGLVENYFKDSLPFTIAGTGSIAIPRVIFKNYGGFSEDISHGEDIELWTKITTAHKVALHNLPTAIHRVNISGRTSDIKTADKRFPDFSQFEAEEQKNPHLKTYLDHNRYGIALMFKLSKDNGNFTLWRSKIDPKNLTKKQRLLLKMPTGLMVTLKKTHQLLMRNGLYISTFR